MALSGYARHRTPGPSRFSRAFATGPPSGTTGAHLQCRKKTTPPATTGLAVDIPSRHSLCRRPCTAWSGTGRERNAPADLQSKQPRRKWGKMRTHIAGPEGTAKATGFLKRGAYKVAKRKHAVIHCSARGEKNGCGLTQLCLGVRSDRFG